MSDEKSAVGEISDFQLEDAAAEMPDSTDVQPDVGLSVAVVQEVDPEGELALLVATSASQCSEDPAEMAEAAYLGRLEPEATMLFKAHLVTCPRCRQPFEETVAFVDAIRAAAKAFESGDGSKVN
jgi:hypothetical protein